MKIQCRSAGKSKIKSLHEAAENIVQIQNRRLRITGKKYRKNRDYIPNDSTEIRHVDEVLKLLQVMTGDKRYEEIFRKKKGVRSMCDVAERLEKMGIEKGIEIGRSEGEIKGKILVYKNLCKEGFDEKEARRLAELPENIIPEQ